MGNYATAAAQAQELLALAEEKVASFWIERATFVFGVAFWLQQANPVMQCS
jgi:hypothetical protein